MHLKIHSSLAYASSANKRCLFRSQSGIHPTSTWKGACGFSIVFTLTMRFPSRTHFVSGCSMFLTWRRFFFLFFRPLSLFRHCFKPGASFVLKVDQCFFCFDVPKLICITMFDHKTVSQAFFDFVNHLWIQIVVYISENKTPFHDFSFPFHLILPENSAIRVS